MKILKQGYILDTRTLNGLRKVCTFTSLMKHSSGKIFSSFRLGSKKDSPDGNGVIAEFVENSDWKIIFSDFRNDFDGISGEIKVVELFERMDGNLSALLTWFDYSKGNKLYNASTDTILPSKILLADSFDMGNTWLNYRVVDTKNLQGPTLTGPVVKIPSGFLAFFEKYGTEDNSKISTHSACAMYSKDGINFEKIITVARHPMDEIYYWDQRSCYDSVNQRIITMFWTYDRKSEKDIDIHIAYGNLETLSWTKPRSTGIKGQIAAPVCLGDGRILCFYVHRHYPGSMRIIMSEDGGQTWDVDSEIIVYHNTAETTEKSINYAEYWEEMNRWNFGHPCGIVLEKNIVLVAYYAGEDVNCLSARWALISV
jgi:hypothetical protein